MTALASWYFIAYFALPAQAYIGPTTAEKCAAIAAIVPEQGICRQAVAMQVCAVGGGPVTGAFSTGTYTACPLFDPPLPRVTVKEIKP